MATIKHIEGWEWLLVSVVYNKRMYYGYIEQMKCQGAVPVKVMEFPRPLGVRICIFMPIASATLLQSLMNAHTVLIS